MPRDPETHEDVERNPSPVSSPITPIDPEIVMPEPDVTVPDKAPDTRQRGQ